MQMMLLTIEAVVAWPTASESRPQRSPRRHPHIAISIPNTKLVMTPMIRSHTLVVSISLSQNSTRFMSRYQTLTKRPPNMPNALDIMPRKGIIIVSPRKRGRTRYSMGEMPIVSNASISSLTFIVPSSAAYAAPERPAMTEPDMIAPSRRSSPMPRKLAT